MGLSHEHVGSKLLAKNKIYILTRAELLLEIPSKKPKSVISGNLSKSGYVWATQWPTFSELKIKFDPSLDRSWLEFFRL